jgi:hypothetical protein
MNINTILPTAYTPNTLAASSVLRSAVSEESTDSQADIFIPVQQAAETSRADSATSDQSSEQVRQQVTQQQQAEQQANQAGQEKQAQQQQAQIDQQTIQTLSTLDREVRNHERAHAAIGGQYAGAPSYEYERGPDGVNYAVSGEVPISTGAASNPQMTIEKAQIIRRAALAPAEPSAQDRKVAAEAVQMESTARVELLTIEREQRIEEQRLHAERSEEGQSMTDGTDSSVNNSGAAGNTTRADQAVDDMNEAQENMFNELTEQLVAMGGAQQPAQSLGSIVSRFA